MENAALVLILVLFGGIGLISIFTVINLVLPALVERTRGVLQASLGRSLLLGLVNSVLAALLVGLLSLPAQQGGAAAGIFIFLIGLVALILAALLLLGLTAAVSLLGARMAQTETVTASSLRGGGLLVLACLTPYLGWFAFTPLVMMTALGAAVKTVLSRTAKVVSAG